MVPQKKKVEVRLPSAHREIFAGLDSKTFLSTNEDFSSTNLDVASRAKGHVTRQSVRAMEFSNVMRRKRMRMRLKRTNDVSAGAVDTIVEKLKEEAT